MGGAVVGVIVYGLLVFAEFWYKPNASVISGGLWVSLAVLEISAFVAVLAILAILGWIGYVMATTPPPVPLEPEPTTKTEGTTSTPSPEKSQSSS